MSESAVYVAFIMSLPFVIGCVVSAWSTRWGKKRWLIVTLLTIIGYFAYLEILQYGNSVSQKNELSVQIAYQKQIELYKEQNLFIMTAVDDSGCLDDVLQRVQELNEKRKLWDIATQGRI
jgi:hypothetical protein